MKPLILLLMLAASRVVLASEASTCQKLIAIKYEGAGADERYFQNAAEAYRDCRGRHLPLEVQVGAYRLYAESHAMRNEPQEAIAVYRKSLEILDASTAAPRVKLPLLIEILDEVALLESRLGLATDAISHGERSLEAQKELFGKKGVEVSRALTRLAILYIEQRDFKAAEPLLRTAIRLAEDGCGPKCDALVDALSGLSVWYHDQGDEARARQYEALSFAAIPESQPRNSHQKH